MAWIAVDKDGDEYIYTNKPIRVNNAIWDVPIGKDIILLPYGSIKKLIGRELEWSDDCIELKEE